MECIFVGISPLAFLLISTKAWGSICKTWSLQTPPHDLFVFLYDAKQKSTRQRTHSLGPCRLIMCFFFQPPPWWLLQRGLQSNPPAELRLLSFGLPQNNQRLAHYCTRPFSLDLLLCNTTPQTHTVKGNLLLPALIGTRATWSRMMRTQSHKAPFYIFWRAASKTTPLFQVWHC